MCYSFDEAFRRFVSQHRREGQIALPRIAQLSSNIMTIGYESDGPLGFVYDAEALRINTERYTPEISDYLVRQIGYLAPDFFVPRVKDFDNALRIAKNIFEPIEITFNETPNILRDVEKFTTQS